MGSEATTSNEQKGSAVPCQPIVRRAVLQGDRVQAMYDGEWFSGVLQSLEGLTAHVQCDIDEPGVLTTVPLFHVRLQQFEAAPVAYKVNDAGGQPKAQAQPQA